ncbi:MAG TPA: class I SAM-dependent methyltransferase [Candidatus Limnocylindria bacterium]|nr:class I SAM-dependent methyltransferase [Candidatus Limnocylindria bacterium]
MSAKQEFLTGEHALAWDDPEVARLYRHRLEYPAALFDLLLDLIGRERPVVLDAGAGTGAIARHLAPRVERVDAVDPALPMIEAGRVLPGGADPRLRWIHAPAETATLDGPYGLITTSQSLHWMDWQIVLPRFAAALAPGARLAIIDDPEEPGPWHEELRAIIARYSIMRTYHHQYALIPELERLGLFVREGEQYVPPVTVTQPVDDYVASFHARSSLARHRIGAAAAARFDAEVRALVGDRRVVERGIGGRIVYGRPVDRP